MPARRPAPPWAWAMISLRVVLAAGDDAAKILPVVGAVPVTV
jgi:hypothetical protein